MGVEVKRMNGKRSLTTTVGEGITTVTAALQNFQYAQNSNFRDITLHRNQSTKHSKFLIGEYSQRNIQVGQHHSQLSPSEIIQWQQHDFS